MNKKWLKPVMRPRSKCINICYLLKIAFNYIWRTSCQVLIFMSSFDYLVQLIKINVRHHFMWLKTPNKLHLLQANIIFKSAKCHFLTFMSKNKNKLFGGRGWRCRINTASSHVEVLPVLGLQSAAYSQSYNVNAKYTDWIHSASHVALSRCTT